MFLDEDQKIKGQGAFMQAPKTRTKNADYNKTDGVLLLLFKLTQSPGLRLNEGEVKSILNLSKSQFYKTINTLLEEVGERKAVLVKIKEEGIIYYQFNKKDWYEFLDATSEVEFILQGLRQLGHLLPSVLGENLVHDSKSIKRKFHFIHQSKPRSNDVESDKRNLELVIRALAGDRKLIINYDNTKEGITIYPLTLIQYKDELYLTCLKDNLDMKNLRTYKISRISNVFETIETFKYPSISKWSPDRFYSSSDLIKAEGHKECQFKVFGHAKNLLSEKSFFSSKILNSTTDYDLYSCEYFSLSEFVSFLFSYADEIEVLSEDVKAEFKKKASMCLQKNA